jgi:hypothetical protein
VRAAASSGAVMMPSERAGVLPKIEISQRNMSSTVRRSDDFLVLHGVIQMSRARSGDRRITEGPTLNRAVRGGDADAGEPNCVRASCALSSWR